MPKLGPGEMSRRSSDTATCHVWKKTWNSLSGPQIILVHKYIVLQKNFTDEIETFEFSVKFYKKCKTKIRLHT